MMDDGFGDEFEDGGATVVTTSPMSFDRKDLPVFFEGSIIAEKYTVEKFLAAGGMGAIYIAEQAPLARRVALKVLHPSLLRDPTAPKRFMREAMAACRLTHPNTIRVFDYGHVDNHLYMAMELLNGESLGDRLERLGTIPPAQVAVIARQAARSLAEAHEKEIVHRDLKPDNIYLSDVGRTIVKVLDFGIASLLDNESAGGEKLTAAGMICGTPEYVSPEQGMAKVLDGRSDLYSLGILMYEMLCGHPPFHGVAAVVAVMKHINVPPDPLPDDVPPNLAKFVVERVLAKEPDDRPPNAQAFIDELAEAVAADGLNADSGELEAIESEPEPAPEPAQFRTSSPSNRPLTQARITGEFRAGGASNNKMIVLALVGGLVLIVLIVVIGLFVL